MIHPRVDIWVTASDELKLDTMIPADLLYRDVMMAGSISIRKLCSTTYIHTYQTSGLFRRWYYDRGVESFESRAIVEWTGHRMVARLGTLSRTCFA